jgi:hypothetical protein
VSCHELTTLEGPSEQIPSGRMGGNCCSTWRSGHTQVPESFDTDLLLGREIATKVCVFARRFDTLRSFVLLYSRAHCRNAQKEDFAHTEDVGRRIRVFSKSTGKTPRSHLPESRATGGPA